LFGQRRTTRCADAEIHSMLALQSVSTNAAPLEVFHFGGSEFIWVIIGRLGLAATLGLVLGSGRHRLRKTAGMRTHMVVCVGSAVFMLAAVLNFLSEEGYSRIIQGITQGIGFLGAGTIIKLSDKEEVKGLTTAASTWLTAAVGVSCGLGQFWLAVLGTLIAWLVLVPLGALERRWEVARQN
jgi:putative Mg2+ transporter-C (MgtC) family protein